MRKRELSDNELIELKQEYDKLIAKENIMMQRFHIPRFHRIKLYTDLKKITVRILALEHIFTKHNTKF